MGGSLGQYVEQRFVSLKAMEEGHHQTLLRSDDEATAVFGYLSVLFWGHYSGQDPTMSMGPRTLSRVRLAKLGATRTRNARIEPMRGVYDLGVEVVARYIRAPVRLVDAEQGGAALKGVVEAAPAELRICLKSVRVHPA